MNEDAQRVKLLHQGHASDHCACLSEALAGWESAEAMAEGERAWTKHALDSVDRYKAVVEFYADESLYTEDWAIADDAGERARQSLSAGLPTMA